jgi:hypothetical protein
MKLLAVFDNGAAARSAMSQIPSGDCEMFSSEPLHTPEVPNHLLKAAVWGGIAGAAIGAGLAVFVFYIVHLHTGHMETITLSPIGIILFGIAALISIAAVLFELLREAGLFRWDLELPDEVRAELVQGSVALLVRSATPEIRQILNDAGARVVS